MRVPRPQRRSASHAKPTRETATTTTKARRKTGQAKRTATAKKQARAASASRLRERAKTLLDTEIAFIANEDFVGRRDNPAELSELATQVELSPESVGPTSSAGLPAHLGRMCATELLTPEQEQELFRRMNFCKYRANSVRSRLARTSPDAEKVAEAEEYLVRAERLRNHLIQANTRLVMSIARKFADARNSFDDLLSQGIASLMHAVEKFDYSRGYRFSTYATCAVRRDLYRLVMSRKKDFQRFTTGTGELLQGAQEEERDPDEMTESGWNHLSGSIQKMLGQLDDRERFIVTYRFGLDESGKKSSYSLLGKRLGISKERVRQLANRALEKMREWAPEHRLEALLA